MHHSKYRSSTRALAVLFVLTVSANLRAQSTIGTGSIIGTVTDPTGAVVAGAKVAITSKATNQTISLATNTAGSFNSGPLNPGDYVVRVSSSGFKTVERSLTVLLNNTATANIKLELGQATEVIQVESTMAAINPEQAEVQDVLDAKQIESQPVNGRNFLDLAQLQALGGVAPTLTAAPSDQAPFRWLRPMDLKLSWIHVIKEASTIEPSVSFYNVGNFANFDLPPGTMNGWLNAGSASINSTPKPADFKVGQGTGVFSLGSPRVIEFGLRLTF